MKGGVDQGWCYSYSKLSYRRKFIRTICFSVIGLPFLLAVHFFGLFERVFRVPHPVQFGWGYIAFFTIVSGLQAWYTHYRWKLEKRNRGSTAD